jgi:DNA-binding HxlR family transcriptional regulator
MRSYDQYCAVARALDVVGDRWTLLIVRELLIRPCRYGELQDGLPGVATNLLAERLRNLEESGVVTRDEQGRYELTAWGKGLATPVRELVRWAAPLMNEKQSGDSFRSRWLEIPLDLMFGGSDPNRPDLEIEVRAGGEEAVTLVSRNGEVRSHSGPANTPDVVVSGPADAIIGLLAGRLDKDAAVGEGVSILGDFEQVARLRQPDWLSERSS